MSARLAVRFGAAVVATMLSFSQALHAESAAEPLPAPIIMVVDPQAVTQQCLAGQAIRTQHDKYRQTYQKEIEVSRNALKETENELVREKPVLPHELWQTKARDFEQRVIDFNQRSQRTTLAVEKSYGVAMTELWRVFNQVTAEVAKEMGANTVLPSQQVIFQDARIDLTRVVTERMNAKYPVVPFPAPVIDSSLSSNPGKK